MALGLRRQRWMAVAALGAAAALAVEAEGTTLNESSVGDFGNRFAARTILPDGTDVVRGLGSDLDYFAFTDLVPGSLFSITLTSLLYEAPFRLYDESQNPLSPPITLPELGEQTLVGSVPLSGELVVLAGGGFLSNFYEVTLVAERVVVPEPSTALLLGAGLAATAALRRHRRA